MGSLLIDRWLAGLRPVPILDQASVSLAREEVRTLGAGLGLGAVELGALAVVVTELAVNQLKYAMGGLVAARALERDGVPGVEVVAADRGPGIADPTGALDGKGSATGSLGVGLSGVLRLSDEVDLDVRLGAGTCVWARKFALRVRRRREVAVLGRACEHERVSGDDAAFVREPHALVLGLVDGLGHGEPALEAAERATSTLLLHAGRPPPEILREADAALTGTRGAVMAVLRADEAAGAFAHAAVGNVATHLYRLDGGRALSGSSFVLGAPGRARPRILEERGPLGGPDVLVMFSDGLTSRAGLHAERDLLRRHPMVAAHHLLRQFGRANDDVTVLVAS